MGYPGPGRSTQDISVSLRKEKEARLDKEQKWKIREQVRMTPRFIT